MDTLLYQRLSQIKSTNPFFSKDLLKAKKANKFIGQGSVASSTHRYMVAAQDLANCGQYEASDVVFVSSEGMRQGRMMPNFEEIQKAIDAHVTFIMDDPYNRERPYNMGESQVAAYLKKHSYQDLGDNGIWTYQESIK